MGGNLLREDILMISSATKTERHMKTEVEK